MFTKEFLLLKQWLTHVGCVVFYLDHPILGKPGDTQFNFLGAELKDGKGTFRFSKILTIEVVEPKRLEIAATHFDLESTKRLRIQWQESVIELNETSLRIES